MAATTTVTVNGIQRTILSSTRTGSEAPHHYQLAGLSGGCDDLDLDPLTGVWMLQTADGTLFTSPEVEIRARRGQGSWRPNLGYATRDAAEARYVLEQEVEAKAVLDEAKSTWSCRDCAEEFTFEAQHASTPACPNCNGCDTVNQFEELVNRLD